MKIAVLGLGQMGHALAGRLAAGGHEVVVWNRTPGRAADLDGVTEAGSVADAVEGVDVALTMLADDDAVRAVALGHEGVVDELHPTGVYVDCSTVSPDLAGELADATGRSRFVSLPVLGSPEAVAAGEASYLAGGEDPVIDHLEPMLAALSPKVTRMATPELALAAKVTLNLLLLFGVVALAEATAVARAGGLGDDAIRSLLGGSPMVAPGVKNRLEAVVNGHTAGWWSTVLGAKDAGLAIAVAAGDGVEVPAATAVRQRYLDAAGAGEADSDIAAVSRIYRPD
jgi:3-hydroxyisobutyrate dehydrogenase-like beta-hydroxyacid dehydrogenase